LALQFYYNWAANLNQEINGAYCGTQLRQSKIMADFKTHMAVSTATGAALAVAGYQAGIHWDTCAVAGCLCSVSGMLPDLDSESGRPLREATALSSAVIPMLMIERLQRLSLGHDTMVLIAIGSYFLIRFLLVELFRRYTVHRGMWHSLPAAFICGSVAFLVISSEDIGVRIFKTAAVVLGFMSHIILDEVWSVEFKRGSYSFKQSFGTALKLWGNSRFANITAYVMCVVLGVAVYQDQGFMQRYHVNPHVPHSLGELYTSVKARLKQSQDAIAGTEVLSGLQSNIGSAQPSTGSLPGTALPGGFQGQSFQGAGQAQVPAGSWPPAPPTKWQ
jgi:membrane-bound metal-dependent hydrolase YbcI (DUF457 family)